MKMPTLEEQVRQVIESALAEDIAKGDITSEALISPEIPGRASFLAKADGVIAGIDFARQVFLRVDHSVKMEIFLGDGTKVKKGDVIAVVFGSLKSILEAERTALNILQRLSGTATMTAQFVERVKGTEAVILDTRKTTPGMRFLEKYAVRMGGGQNHRMHAGDWLIIKDNHIAVLRRHGLSLKEIVELARKKAPKGKRIEVEVTTFAEAMEAAAGKADWIMLDNMSPAEMKRVNEAVPANITLEASGGITLDNVREVALSGVDYISSGSLTHSVKAMDISLEFEL